MSRVAVLLATGVVIGGGAPTSAQNIRGRVLDESNGAPVSIAGVYLLEADRALAARVLTDSLGHFVLRVPGAGEYYLVAHGFGYFETESPLVRVETDRAYDVDLSLRPEPISVDGLRVEVPAPRQNRWARERLHYMDNRYWNANPVSARGFRLIMGARLEEAKLESDDTLELLRRVYVPVYNTLDPDLDALCVEMRPEFDRHGGLPERVCGHVYLDGIALGPEHIPSLDFRTFHAVMLVPPEIHIMTLGFEQEFQARRGR